MLQNLFTPVLQITGLELIPLLLLVLVAVLIFKRK